MRAIVTGISGQDGYYLASLLLGRGYEVLGLSSAAQPRNEFGQAYPGAFQVRSFDYVTPQAIAAVIEDYRPDLIFNLAAKATGEGMFDAPYELARLNGGFVLDILEAMRKSPRRDSMVLCQASSSEMYGRVTETPQTELTPFWPRSPYGVAKLYAHNMIGIYRTAYGVRACSAILYNHESVRRSTRFVTKKIAQGAVLIKKGRMESLTLGNLDARRDWGYAPEYVDAMYRMATAPVMDDYIVATGRLSTVRQLCEIAFGRVGLDYTRFVRTSADAGRVIESVSLHGDPRRIAEALGWRALRTVPEIMTEMVDEELRRLEAESIAS